jgi:hypothetical protein
LLRILLLTGILLAAIIVTIVGGGVWDDFVRKQGLGLAARRLPLVLEPDLSERRVGPRSLASVLRDICWQARLFNINRNSHHHQQLLPSTAQNSKTTSSAFKKKSFINFYKNKKKKKSLL